jgi:hypothetical protein
MKIRFPLLIAIAAGALMVLSFFARGPVVDGLTDGAYQWQSIVAGIALFLGVISIIEVHWRRIVTRHVDRVYSAILLVCLLAMAASGALQGIGTGTVFNWLFEKLQAPMMATMFSMLAFFIASAAYRAFRARTITSAILLVTAIIVMLGRIPVGQFVYSDFPSITNWIMMIPSVAVQRGILIGAALGAASISLRVLLGIERSYLGRG